MSSTSRAHAVGNAGTSSASSAKSHVLATVQDAYWSDDEAEDTDCPLCMDPMDLDDLAFKPCTCGYQICRFCWDHVRKHMNGRCPACRRPYTDEGIEFKPINADDQKRLNQQKRQRERERKEIANLKRSQYVNMRVVQRNLVYVTGMGSRFAKEEFIPTLRSTEYFGKYGKIMKMILVKRKQSGFDIPVVGLYITYQRREDASRAIAAVDGTASPGGGDEVVRASHGTTKYCMSFLRNVSCTNPGCLDLHEWGDEKDSFTKEDLTTLKHTMRDTEYRPRIVSSRKVDEPDAPALPRSASWGQKGGTPVLAPAAAAPLPTPSSSSTSNGRGSRSGGGRSRIASGTTGLSTSKLGTDAGLGTSRTRAKVAPLNTLSTTTVSRPTTPASLPPKPTAAAEAALAASEAASTTNSSSPTSPKGNSSKAGVMPTSTPSHIRNKKSIDKSASSTTSSPMKSIPSQPKAIVSVPAPTVDEDWSSSPVPAAARVQDLRSEELVPPLSPASTTTDSLPSNQTPPPTAPPPGLSLATAPDIATSATSIPQSTTSTYQLSNQAQALMDDMLNRRTSAGGLSENAGSPSPFPDFDKTLSNLTDGTFSFNLTTDPKLAKIQVEEDPFGILSLSSLVASSVVPGHYDPFAHPLPSPTAAVSFSASGLSLRRPPSSSGYANSPLSSVVDLDSKMSRTLISGGSATYSGAFNPFSEGADRTASPAPSSLVSVLDDDPLRKGSKFGFARKDGSVNGSALSAFGGSASNSPLRYTDSLPLLGSTTPNLVNSESNHLFKPHLRPPSQEPSWGFGPRPSTSIQPDYGVHIPPPPGLSLPQDKSSPRLQYQSPTANSAFPTSLQQSTYGSYDQSGPTNDISLNLRELLHMSERHIDPMSFNHSLQQDPGSLQMHSNPGFVDPAIMSMSLSPAFREGPFSPNPISGNVGPSNVQNTLSHLPPPPGISSMEGPHGFARKQSNGAISLASASNQQTVNEEEPEVSESLTSSIESPALSPSDFPSLPTITKAKPTQSPKGRAPLILPNLQPPPPKVAISSSIYLPGETKSVKAKGSRSRETIPLPPKPTFTADVPVDSVTVSSSMTNMTTNNQNTPINSASNKSTPAEASSTPAEANSPATNQSTHTSKSATRRAARQNVVATAIAVPTPTVAEQEAVISRKTKKNKPLARPVKKKDTSKSKADDDKALSVMSADSKQPGDEGISSQIANDLDALSNSLEALDPFLRLTPIVRDYYLENLAFFDPSCIDVDSPEMGYESLVRALSALSNGAPINSLPVEAIDAAVSSFQRLLEMLSQTISDLLRLLPRLAWTDTASLDAMLKDMIRSGECLEDDGLDAAAAAAAQAAFDSHSDDVNALTDALSKRAKWMEAQLLKLEALHHDVNSAAVRVVMYFNERGWDRSAILPRSKDALSQFDGLGLVNEDGIGSSRTRKMNVTELEEALENSLKDEIAVEAKLRDVMMGNRRLLAYSAH